MTLERSSVTEHADAANNRTYLRLPLLEELVAAHDLTPSYVADLLVADVVRHELEAALRHTDPAPLGRPDPQVMRTRVRHALRFLDPRLEPAATRTPQLPSPPEEARELFDATVRPVTTVHDEYLFIRVLQAHEMMFAAMRQQLDDAVAAVGAREHDLAALLVDEVTLLLTRAAILVRAMATIRVEAFDAFGGLIDETSAIRSEEYQRFAARYGGDVAERGTLTSAYREARARRGAGLGKVATAMDRLEDGHRRWLSAHVSLASQLLDGSATPDLALGADHAWQRVAHRLFRLLPAPAAETRSRRSA